MITNKLLEMNNMKTEIIKYVTTNGLMANHESFKKPRMCKIVFEIMSDGSVDCYAENARTGGMIKMMGKKTITREALRDMPEDAYNSMVFNRAAFSMFGITI